jgi:Flp pilus assembly pilin Flp
MSHASANTEGTKKGLAMLKNVLATWQAEEGQTTVEYALITTLVIGLAVVSIAVLNGPIGGIFSVVLDRLTALA